MGASALRAGLMKNSQPSTGTETKPQQRRRFSLKEELWQNREQLRELVELSPDVIARFDRQLRHMFISPAVERILGMPPAAFLGKTMAEVGMSPDAFEEWKRVTLDVFENGGEQELEFELAGRVFFARLAAQRNAQGGVDSVVGIGRDVTCRKRVEDALRDSEHRYRSLFDLANDAIFIMDGCRFIQCNRRTLQMFGCAREEIIGCSPFHFSPPNQPDGQDSTIKAMAKVESALAGTPEFFEWKHIRRDGTLFDAEVSLNRIDADGRTMLQAIVRDITERKKTEENLKAALEEKNLLLREVHHRVKNNLQVIISLMQMSSLQVEDPAARQLLMRIQTQARAMSLVYEQLHQSKNLAQVHLPSYLKQLVSYVLQVFAKDNRPMVELDIDEMTMDVERATPCGLIVNELVTNAVKHAFPRGFAGSPTIRVALKCQDDGVCVLTVTDNGMGMPAEFDIETAKSMGLHLVYLWATHQLGGGCAVQTNHGTTFTIRFDCPPEKMDK